jgi:Na+(H+)/acetate symporter ActP
MVFVFHQLTPAPLFFNESELARVRRSPRAAELATLEQAHEGAGARKRAEIASLRAALDAQPRDPTAVAAAEARVRAAGAEDAGLRKQTRALVAALPHGEPNDADYVFLSFVMAHLPRGLIGLLLAVIFCAAMSSTASELTALAGCTLVDFYKRSWKPTAPDSHYVRVAKLFTAGWGLLALVFAASAALVDNLIQAVNILGSLFYGTILGIFLVAFFVRRARATPVFIAAILSEALVIGVWLTTDIGFLWFNVIGCAAVVGGSLAIGAVTADTRAA